MGADKVATGSFGAYMQVYLCNDGPVTVELNAEAPASPSSDAAGARSGRVSGDAPSRVARGATSRRTATHPSCRTRGFSCVPSRALVIGATAASARFLVGLARRRVAP